MDSRIVTDLNTWMWAKDGRVRFIRFLANPFIGLVTMAALALVLGDAETRAFFIEEITTVALALIIARGVLTPLLHLLSRRPRPYALLELMRVIVPRGRKAFPSGHAAFFSALGFALLPIAVLPGQLLLGATLINGFARVAGALHWPTDVLAGFVVGYAGFWLAVQFLTLG